MANLPIRKLGQLGFVPDAKSYDLALNGYSDCANVVFDELSVSRAPVFKELFMALRSPIATHDLGGTVDAATVPCDSAAGAPVSDVRFVSSYADPVAGETVIVADRSGEVRGYPNGNLTFLTPGAGGLTTNDNPWAHAQVAGLSFLSRKGQVPYVRKIATAGAYVYMGGEWANTTTCRLIRGYNDFAVAIGVTKAGVEYPTMVKWSNPIEYGTAPAGLLWDETNPNYNAGENILGELTSPIRDALTLGSVMILYSKDQVWLMEYTGSTLVFNFRRLFPTGGIVNTNCVVEVDGRHFVFGEDDLYMHDGMSKQSLADGRVRRAIFSDLDRAKLSACFVQHDPVSNLIFFCYPSRGALAYQDTQFCNRAAVYNYRSDTWSLMDLPNIAGGAPVNVDLAQNAYLANGPSVSELYDTSAAAPAGSTPRISVMLGVPDAGAGVTSARVYAIDGTGMVRLDAHPEALKPAYVERTGIDLDDPGLNLKLRSYKAVTGVTPQIEFAGNPGELRWLTGSSDKPNGAPVWYSDKVFDPATDYQLDMRVTGRYIAYAVRVSGPKDFKLSGFDAEIKPLSHR